MRPTKLTEEVKAIIIKAIEEGVTYDAAAAEAGIHERTFHYWINRGKKAKKGKFFQFFQDIKRANEIGKGKLLREIRQDKSWQAKAWLLERRFPDEFGRQIIDLQSKGEGITEIKEIRIIKTDKKDD